MRLLVPGQYGYKSVKWVARLEATASDAPFGSYQEALGYTDDGRVQVVNKATNPLRNAQLSAGPVAIFGLAISGLAGVERVEVSINDAPFAAAALVDLPEVLSANPPAPLHPSGRQRLPLPLSLSRRLGALAVSVGCRGRRPLHSHPGRGPRRQLPARNR